MSFNILPVLLLACVLSTGCDTRDSGGAAGSSSASAGTSTNPAGSTSLDSDTTSDAEDSAATGEASDAASHFDGVWETVGCQPDPAKPLLSNAFQTQTLRLSAGAYSLQYENYKDAFCTQQDPQGVRGGLTGSYAIGGVLTSSDGITAHALDIHITGTATDGSPVTGPLDGATLLDIIALTEQFLYLGLGITDVKLGTRPTGLDLSRPFQRLSTP
jgi:hypothetical protein